MAARQRLTPAHPWNTTSMPGQSVCHSSSGSQWATMRSSSRDSNASKIGRQADEMSSSTVQVSRAYGSG
jgi:hypothetical protein